MSFPIEQMRLTHSYPANINIKNEWCKFFFKKNDIFFKNCCFAENKKEKSERKIGF
jgi:hypothetical protein